MRIPWADKLTNEEVLQRAGVERKLIGEIRTRLRSCLFCEGRISVLKR